MAEVNITIKLRLCEERFNADFQFLIGIFSGIFRARSLIYDDK